MDQDATSHLSAWGLVEIKGAVKELPRGDPRIEGSPSQKIESELSLWKEDVPKVWGKGQIHSGHNGKEVVLESLNCALSMVTAIHVRGK